MGHAINPISFRLYFSRYWNSNWYTLDNYSYFLIKDLQLNEYFYSFFHKNRRNRIFFYKKFMYDSLSVYKKINKFFITINVFDFRIKTYKTIPFVKKYYMPILQSYNTVKLYRNFLKNNQINRIFKYYKKKYYMMPWLYRQYLNKLYFNLSKINLLTKNVNKKQKYNKNFFFAYLLYVRQLDNQLESRILFNKSLKTFIFSILDNYHSFLNLSKSSNLNKQIGDYTKYLYESKSLINIKYTTSDYLKNKLKDIKFIFQMNSLKNKEKKFRKFFVFTLQNLVFLKNLILKYKNLLFLINKRLDLFLYKNKLNGNKVNKNKLIINLYWRRDRLISLIYFLRKRSKRYKLKFKTDILKLKENIIKLKNFNFKNNTNDILFMNVKYNILKNLNKKFIFLNLFKNINFLNKRFLVYQYLSLLDKSKLLRFNYRFSVYKQAILKLVQQNKLTFFLANKSNLHKKKLDNLFKFSRLYINQKNNNFSFKEQFIIKNNESNGNLFYLSNNEKFFPFSKSASFRLKNFFNVFHNKLARVNLWTSFNDIKGNLNSNLTFEKLSDLSLLVNSQISLLNNLDKKINVLKSENINNNYKYFLNYLTINNVYKFNNLDLINKYSFKNVLVSIIKKLNKKNFTKKNLKSYLKKKYVYLLFRKFFRKKFSFKLHIFQRIYKLKTLSKFSKYNVYAKVNRNVLCKKESCLNCSCLHCDCKSFKNSNSICDKEIKFSSKLGKKINKLNFNKLYKYNLLFKKNNNLILKRDWYPSSWLIKWVSQKSENHLYDLSSWSNVHNLNKLTRSGSFKLKNSNSNFNKERNLALRSLSQALSRWGRMKFYSQKLKQNYLKINNVFLNFSDLNSNKSLFFYGSKYCSDFYIKNKYIFSLIDLIKWEKYYFSKNILNNSLNNITNKEKRQIFVNSYWNSIKKNIKQPNTLRKSVVFSYKYNSKLNGLNLKSNNLKFYDYLHNYNHIIPGINFINLSRNVSSFFINKLNRTKVNLTSRNNNFNILFYNLNSYNQLNKLLNLKLKNSFNNNNNSNSNSNSNSNKNNNNLLLIYKKNNVKFNYFFINQYSKYIGFNLLNSQKFRVSRNKIIDNLTINKIVNIDHKFNNSKLFFSKVSKDQNKYNRIFGRSFRHRMYKKLNYNFPLNIKNSDNLIKLYMFNKNKIRLYQKSYIDNRWKIISYSILKKNSLKNSRLLNFTSINKDKFKLTKKESEYNLYNVTSNKYFNSKFLRYWVFSNSEEFFTNKVFKKFLNEFNQIKNVKFNVKRITQGNVYSWNKKSNLIYNSYFKRFNVNLRIYNKFKSLFLNKIIIEKQRYLSLNFLSFYSFTHNLLLRKKYNLSFINVINNNNNNSIVLLNKLYTYINTINSNSYKKLFIYSIFKNLINKKFNYKEKYKFIPKSKTKFLYGKYRKINKFNYYGLSKSFSNYHLNKIKFLTFINVFFNKFNMNKRYTFSSKIKSNILFFYSYYRRFKNKKINSNLFLRNSKIMLFNSLINRNWYNNNNNININNLIFGNKIYNINFIYKKLQLLLNNRNKFTIRNLYGALFSKYKNILKPSSIHIGNSKLKYVYYRSIRSNKFPFIGIKNNYISLLNKQFIKNFYPKIVRGISNNRFKYHLSFNSWIQYKSNKLIKFKSKSKLLKRNKYLNNIFFSHNSFYKFFNKYNNLYINNIEKDINVKYVNHYVKHYNWFTLYLNYKNISKNISKNYIFKNNLNIKLNQLSPRYFNYIWSIWKLFLSKRILKKKELPFLISNSIPLSIINNDFLNIKKKKNLFFLNTKSVLFSKRYNIVSKYNLYLILKNNRNKYLKKNINIFLDRNLINLKYNLFTLKNKLYFNNNELTGKYFEKFNYLYFSQKYKFNKNILLLGKTYGFLNFPNNKIFLSCKKVKNSVLYKQQKFISLFFKFTFNPKGNSKKYFDSINSKVNYVSYFNKLSSLYLHNSKYRNRFLFSLRKFNKLIYVNKYFLNKQQRFLISTKYHNNIIWQQLLTYKHRLSQISNLNLKKINNIYFNFNIINKFLFKKTKFNSLNLTSLVVNKKNLFNKYLIFYKNIKNRIKFYSSLKLKKYSSSWLYSKKNKESLSVGSSLILTKINPISITVLNKNRIFFLKLLKYLGFNNLFSKTSMLNLNINLFIYIIKYLLLKKFINNNLILKVYKSIYISNILSKYSRYKNLFTYLGNLNINFLTIKSTNKFIFQEKVNLITNWNKLPKNINNSEHLKLNLFIIYFNILLKFRLIHKEKKKKIRLLLLAYNFQKYLWLKDKKYKHYLYELNFESKYKSTVNSNIKITSTLILKQSKLNWRKRNWKYILSKFQSVEIFFLRNKFYNKFQTNIQIVQKFIKFRIKLKMKILGATYYYLSFFFKWHLTRLFFKNELNSVYIRFNIMLEPSAFYISKYICNYLKKGLKLNQIVNSLIYNLPKLYPNILAVQVKCVGRHTRKERASKNWFRNGSLNIANIKSKLDYASTGVVLHYGYTNIKVWLLKVDKVTSSVGIATSFV